MHDPIKIVRTFIEEMISKNNIPGMLDMLADDIYYQNMPLAPAIGKAQMIDF